MSEAGHVPRMTVPALSAMSGVGIAPRLQVTVEREAGAPCSRTLVHDGDTVKVGSHPGNDVVVADPLVSRFHCRLSKRGGPWQLEDNRSLNGTSISGILVRDADIPRSGCTIELGDSRIHVREIDPSAKEPLRASATCGSLHGGSAAMRKLFTLIERVAPTDATVLIEGETGTGKELVAAEIARQGLRAKKPFIIVDCGAISPHLFESKLFGHCRGAFTGADRDSVGAFEAATGGTIFLDEIGEMPLDMQPKLLRVLQSRAVCRVGETRVRPVDVRVVAATNRRLEVEVNRGTFREDLFFRLSVITLRVPPLRDRLDDLSLLVRAILDSLGLPKSHALFDAEMLSRMAAHDWPGNVRELRNYVERAVVLDSAESAMGDESSPLSTLDRAAGGAPVEVDLDVPLRDAKQALVAAFEKRYLAAALEWSEGNVTRAAKKAGMDRITVHRLIQRYGLRSSRSVED